ncbi:ABC transporter ATP-binding protein [Williamsia sp. SKLECPSW1]
MTGPAPAAALPVATWRRTLRWFADDLRRRPALLGGAIVVGLAAAAVSVVPIYVLGSLIDRVREGSPASDVVVPAIVIAVTVVLGGLGTGVAGYLVQRLGETSLADLRETVMDRAVRLPVGMVDAAGRGDLLSRVGADVAAVTQAVSQVLPTMINGIFLGLLTLTSMTGVDWRLGLAAALSIPAYVAAARWYLPRSAPMYADERRAIGTRAQSVVEALQGLPTIAAYERLDHHRREIHTSSAAARDISVGVFRLFTRFVGRVNRAEFIGLGAILVVGFVLVRDDAVSVGAVTAAALLFHRLFNPIGAVLYDFDEIQSASASLSRLVGVCDLPDPPPPSGALPADATVELDGVFHSYVPGRPVLQDISLTLEPGTTTALVGSTGAGKTTLAAIVAGTLTPSSGAVRVGGVAPDAVPLDGRGGHVATVTQEVHVFAGPLVDDLRLAAPEAGLEQVWEALDVVGARGWVSALPDGLDTVVGEGGHPLTAAQGQHLALTRVVLADPAVVVLDEATAEAGSADSRGLEDAARAATAGRTTLVVAHRLTQAAIADVVLVMEDGRIVEAGPHAQLANRPGGRYARLWSAWIMRS